jgi:hypothetical protein
MATGKTGLRIWLAAVVLLWTVYPLFFSQARAVLMFAALTGLTAGLGCLSGLQVLVFWSAVLGLLNITLVLLLTSYPLSLWTGLSAGLTLFALLDSSQRFTYLRHCQVEAGVVTAHLDTFVRLSGLCVLVGLGLGCILTVVGPLFANIAAASLLTIAGACVFVSCLALFLLYANRLPES